MARINFSTRVYGQISKEKIKEEILQSLETSKEMRKEIARVFQVANRRIQNIESKGLLSPALAALNKGDITGYSKFKMSGQTWDELKLEYAKAVGFLKQPTSTATGTREYNNHLKRAYNLTDREFDVMAKKINDTLTSVSDSQWVEQYLMRYKDFTGDLEQQAQDVSQQIESDAQQVENAIDREIEMKAQQAANDLREMQDEITATIQRAFDNFKF